ncbi:phage holin family protein [Salmonella enterica subsp. enterica]|nr:phage holin family protein [Salmonella enterica subsp. enterica]
MFYRRGDATHRPLISLLAYVMVLVYMPLLPVCFCLYESSHWLVVMVNISFAPLCACGNVGASLVDAPRH